MKVILDDFDIMEEPQAISSLTLRRLDSPSGKLVGQCGPNQNIVHASNEAANGMSEVIPKLNEKFTSMVFCVPTPNMLGMDLTYHLEKVTKYNASRK